MGSAIVFMPTTGRYFISGAALVVFLICTLSFNAYRRAKDEAEQWFEPSDFPMGYKRTMRYEPINLGWTVEYKFFQPAMYERAWTSAPMFGPVNTGGSLYFHRKKLKARGIIEKGVFKPVGEVDGDNRR